MRLLGTGGEQLDITLDLTTNNQEFFEGVSFAVNEVLFDPESDLISNNDTVALSTEDFTLGLPLLLYPNPASDYITLESVEEPKFPIYLSLINSMGQTMMYTQLRTKNKRIDISNYNSGVYTHGYAFRINSTNQFRMVWRDPGDSAGDVLHDHGENARLVHSNSHQHS